MCVHTDAPCPGSPFIPTGHTKAVTTVYADPEGWVLSGGGTAVHVWGAKGIRDGTVIRGHDAMVRTALRHGPWGTAPSLRLRPCMAPLRQNAT